MISLKEFGNSGSGGGSAALAASYYYALNREMELIMVREIKYLKLQKFSQQVSTKSG